MSAVFRHAYLTRSTILILGGLLAVTVIYAWQKPFREYPGVEYEHYPIPPDFRDKTEWAFARLMYPPVPARNGGFAFSGSWKEGGSNWTMDYPRSDRHLSAAVRRLTRIHARSVEEPIDLDDGDVFDWPWLYGVEVGHWNLTDPQAATMREFLLRGGFFMCDDFHGTVEWSFFERQHAQGISRPAHRGDRFGRPHLPHHLRPGPALPGARRAVSGDRAGLGEGRQSAALAGIYDDHGRIMVAMCFNMDLGDSWEHADNPQYPANFSDLGIRIGVNYIVYAMSH